MQEQRHLGVVQELHQPARRNYPRRSFEIRHLDETWQADLVEMIPYAAQNKQNRYLLTVIDIFSKYAWVRALRGKTGEQVTNAMHDILAEGRVPKCLHTDRGKEFYNRQFQYLMQKHNIKLYSTYSSMKASICERFNRTLKTAMWRKFTLQGNHKWLDILPDLISQYNARVHRTMGMRPQDVTVVHKQYILDRLVAQRRQRRRSAKFRVGDRVRVSKSKHAFEKGYTLNWSTEIFTIDRRIATNP